jgi:hypothetical protein
VLRDTVLDAVPSGDTSFAGYVVPGAAGAGLLVSDSVPAGDDRAFLRFIARPDSVSVTDTSRTYAIDSVAITLTVLARDTTVHGLSLYVYRIPVTLDSSASFATVDSQLTPANLLDSVAVADTLTSQVLRLVYPDTALARVAIPAGDSGRLALGFRVRATGGRAAIRLGGIGSGSGVPSFATYVTASGVADTIARHQTIFRGPEFTRYVERVPVTADPNLLALGGATGARALIRFPFPAYLKDSVLLVRATLRLFPADTIHGLEGDSAFVQTRGILADFGAKSPRASTVTSTFLADGTIDSVLVESVQQVREWQYRTPAVPTALFLNLGPEGASFTAPRFKSTRSASGAPRLFITYQVPFKFERP